METEGMIYLNPRMPPLSGWKSHRALQTKGCGMAQAKAQSMGQSTHFTHAKVA